MKELRGLIGSTQRQLYANALLRSIFLSGTCYLLIYTILKLIGLLANPLLPAGIAALIVFVVSAYLNGIHLDKKPVAVSLIHQSIGTAEYSLGLLEKDELNIAEQLQIDRLVFKLNNSNPDLAFPLDKIYRGIGWYALIFGLATGLYIAAPFFKFSTTSKKEVQETFAQASNQPVQPPKFVSARLRITPPSYTGIPEKTTKDLNISTIQGALVHWNIQFDSNEKLSVRLANSSGAEIQFKMSGKDKNSFEHTDKVTSSGLYSIRAYWADSLVYQSDFYKLESITDKAPVIEPASKELYRLHYLKDPQSVRVKAKMTDDFEVNEAYIVATVARGSGENVKFREVRFPLSPNHFRHAQLDKTIDLKALNFTPGDELYYYWAAIDNKKPEPNFTKSDTYFIVYKDTANNGASELATMALDIMPEYFRSQRQIIIDTKKLIANKKKLTKEVFNSTSNEIGFDQKVLRLRYGQYLGEEFESNMGGAAIPDEDEGNILASFEHKSDASEEDGFRQQKKIKKEEKHEDSHGHGGEEQDAMLAILEQFTHGHDDEETSTFYEESTKNMLRVALEQMWQSELHLRMYEPEKAIPYETKALEYLKNAQNKVRAFVKKSGFDPPPIKEKEKRLSGKLDDIKEQKDGQKSYDEKTTGQLVAKVLGYVDYPKMNATQKADLQLAGSKLSGILLGMKNGRLRDWPILTSMQKMMEGKQLTANEKLKLKSALLALSSRTAETGDGYASESKLEKAFWQGIR
jgi:hypothetical protein